MTVKILHHQQRVIHHRIRSPILTEYHRINLVQGCAVVRDKNDSAIVITAGSTQIIKPLSQLQQCSHVDLIMLHLSQRLHMQSLPISSKPVGMFTVINPVVNHR